MVHILSRNINRYDIDVAVVFRLRVTVIVKYNLLYMYIYIYLSTGSSLATVEKYRIIFLEVLHQFLIFFVSMSLRE